MAAKKPENLPGEGEVVVVGNLIHIEEDKILV